MHFSRHFMRTDTSTSVGNYIEATYEKGRMALFSTLQSKWITKNWLSKMTSTLTSLHSVSIIMLHNTSMNWGAIDMGQYARSWICSARVIYMQVIRIILFHARHNYNGGIWSGVCTSDKVKLMTGNEKKGAAVLNRRADSGVVLNGIINPSDISCWWQRDQSVLVRKEKGPQYPGLTASRITCKAETRSPCSASVSNVPYCSFRNLI